MGSNKLTSRRLKTLQFVERFIAEKGYSPSYEEIRRALRLNSTSMVHRDVVALEKAGYLERPPGVRRGLRLAHRQPQAQSFSVPVLGTISAGEPLDWGDDLGEALKLTGDIVRQQEGLYALRVKGNSMIDAMVNDGDIVIMKHQRQAHNGDMVAVRLLDRDETTLKHFYRENGHVRLQPANPTMDPLYVHPSNVEVQGKVVAVIRRLDGVAGRPS